GSLDLACGKHICLLFAAWAYAYAYVGGPTIRTKGAKHWPTWHSPSIS
ncbi:hypothetical protein PanWU01x14_154320, partial [Parasponia andersonii]